MADKQFKVGQRWRTEGGAPVVIHTILRDQMITTCGRTYELDGKYSLQNTRGVWNLVELLEDPDDPVETQGCQTSKVEPLVKSEARPTQKCNCCSHVRELNPFGYTKCECGGNYVCVTEPLVLQPPVKTENKPLFHVGQEGVTTQDGRKVRILCVDLQDCDTVIAAAVMEDDNHEYLYRYLATGKRYRDSDHATDLIPPPPPKQYAWMFVYKDPDGNLIGGNPHRIKVPKENSSVSFGGAVGYVRIELAERWDE